MAVYPAMSWASSAFAPMPGSIHTGRAPAMLLLRGLGGASLEPRFLVSKLREHGFHVATQSIATSDHQDAATKHDDARPVFRDWISASTEAIDRLASVHAEVNLCGISLGATLALAVAAERPLAIRCLTIISMPLYCDGWNVPRWRQFMPILCRTPLWRLYRPRERHPYGVKNECVRAWIAEQLEIVRLTLRCKPPKMPAWLFREADRLTRHVRHSLGRVRSPTLMIHAREDDIASLANVRYVQRHLGTGEFSAVIVDNSYHLVAFDNERDYVAAKTIQFINFRTRLLMDPAMDCDDG